MPSADGCFNSDIRLNATLWQLMSDQDSNLTWTCSPSAYVSVFSTVSVTLSLAASWTMSALRALVRELLIPTYSSFTVLVSLAGQVHWSNARSGGSGSSAEYRRSLYQFSRFSILSQLLTCLCSGCSSCGSA
jgi:hypothetical protein